MKLISNVDVPAYLPRLKVKGFNPAPVQGNIPAYADVRSDPTVVTTQAYKDYWNEQVYYCENGYETGGMFIPGRYYHFLNFKIIDGVMGPQYPDYVDLHHELYETVDFVKKSKEYVGLVFPKGRRKGLSFFGTELIDYGARFIQRYRALVAGGESSYVDGFRSKLYRTYNNTVPEFKLNHLRRNDNEFMLGWNEKSDQGMQEHQHAHIFFKSMKDNPKKGEGEYFHDVILEEFGIFEKGITTITSITPALKHGNIIAGTIYAYGTGGNILRGAKAFKELWYNAESFKFIRMFISGARYYVPYVSGTKDPESKADISEIPNILNKFGEDIDRSQILGCEDVKAAEEDIRAERIIKAKNPNKSQLREWNQHMPLTVEEVFVSGGINKFDPDKLYQQSMRIDENKVKYREFVLDFVTNDDGEIETPLKVKARPAKNTDKDWEIIKVLEEPRLSYKDLDVVGIDSYNEDQTDTSKSLGGVCVLRRYDKISDKDNQFLKAENGIVPVCTYYERPPRKEMFWEISLKIAVWYGAFRNTMISAESDMTIQYFKNNFGKKYLAKRPKAFDAPDSKLMHEFGVKMTGFSLPRMLSILQSWVMDHAHTCWFSELINDLLAYDEENIGTDYDLADALGYALMRVIEMKKNPSKKDVNNQKKDLSLPDYTRNSAGTIVDKNDESDDGSELEDWELIILGQQEHNDNSL